MAIISWYQKKYVILPTFAILLVFVLFKNLCIPDNTLADISQTNSEISSLKTLVNIVQERFSGHLLQFVNSTKVHERFLQYFNSSMIPKIYLITPTYTRYTQQADLVRLSNTLKLVLKLHWIVIEDSESKTDLVQSFLKTCQIKNTHLNIRTQRDLQMEKADPRWKKHRGVDQRNYALRWIRQNVSPDENAVVYFADDDNTYHMTLFDEMRNTKSVSIWPVALVGGLRWEGPICKNGKVLKFFTAWKPERMFPVDMAAFAINIALLFKYPEVYINPDVARGYLESDFLQQLHITKEMLEAKAEDCSKILVWHTQTAEPKMKDEIRLQREGRGSDPRIII